MASKHIDTLNMVAQGDWDGAHQLIQKFNDELACLIHAYLHRIEGDLDNASYWYNRVGQDIPENSLEQEFDRLLSLAKDS